MPHGRASGHPPVFAAHEEPNLRGRRPLTSPFVGIGLRSGNERRRPRRAALLGETGRLVETPVCSENRVEVARELHQGEVLDAERDGEPAQHPGGGVVQPAVLDRARMVPQRPVRPRPSRPRPLRASGAGRGAATARAAGLGGLLPGPGGGAARRHAQGSDLRPERRRPSRARRLPCPAALERRAAVVRVDDRDTVAADARIAGSGDRPGQRGDPLSTPELARRSPAARPVRGSRGEPRPRTRSRSSPTTSCASSPSTRPPWRCRPARLCWSVSGSGLICCPTPPRGCTAT